jgi:hypothetical protein
MDAMEIQFLNARQGDAIWVRWGSGHQLLVDLGTEETGQAFADRMRALDEKQRAFDLLVVTHVDTDHIGGILSGIVDQQASISGWTFGDVWFNGWEHLHGKSPSHQPPPLEPMGGNHGELFAAWLRTQSWNAAFSQAPAIRTDSELPRLELPDNLTITLIAPVMQRLTDEIPKWQDDVERSMARGELKDISLSPGLQALGAKEAPVLTSEADLQEEAEKWFSPDNSKSNATSIVMLLEWRGRRVLLTGDSTSSELVSGLELLEGGKPVALDLVKLPHHGSHRNVLTPFVETIDCAHWVFSTDGTSHRHPDSAAVARVLRGGASSLTLHFNRRSTYSGWWDNEDWQQLFDYSVNYGTPDDGLTITLHPA